MRVEPLRDGTWIVAADKSIECARKPSSALILDAFAEQDVRVIIQLLGRSSQLGRSAMATTSGHEEAQASLSMKGGEAPVRAEGFNHLHLNVRDLARSIRFYKEAFGLKVGFSAGPELIFMVPEVGGHSLALHLVKPDEPVGMAGGFQHFGFKLAVNDHDRAIKQVEQAGGKVLSRGKHGG